jgi:hypothetical protein
LDLINQVRTVQAVTTQRQIQQAILQQTALHQAITRREQLTRFNDQLQENQRVREEKEQAPKAVMTTAALTDEQRAKIKLGLAKRLAEAGLKQDAEESYQEVVAKYPDTLAANEARQLLGLPLRKSPGESSADERPSAALLQVPAIMSSVQIQSPK